MTKITYGDPKKSWSYIDGPINGRTDDVSYKADKTAAAKFMDTGTAAMAAIQLLRVDALLINPAGWQRRTGQKHEEKENNMKEN